MCLQPLRFTLVVPGAQTSENVSHEIRVLIIAGDSPDPHLWQREHKINLLRPHSGTLLRRLSRTEDEDNDGSDTIDPCDLQEYVRDELQVLATCMDNGEKDAPIPGVDNSQLETACLKLAELPEALAIVQAAWRGASDSNRHSRVLVLLQAVRANLDNHSADIVYPTVHVINDRAMTDQLRSSEELNDLGHSLNNAEARICKQSWTN